MIRIGLSCNFIEPALCQGKLDGIGTFTQGLYQQLQANGEAVLPVVFPTSFKAASYTLPNIAVMPQPYPLAAALSTFLGIETPGMPAIDLYHCTDYLIPRLKKIPVIAMLHDAVKVQHPSWNSQRWRTLKNWGLKKAIHWASHYTTPSQAMVPELVEYFGIDEKKITVIHNALDDSWLEPLTVDYKTQILKKYQLRPGFLLFAGTLQPRKNIARLLTVIKSLPASIQKEHPLVLVGQQGWLEQAHIEEIKKLNAQGLVYWLNYVNLTELRALYQSATIFLLPSLHEGFGFPLLEAFASQTPVITSNLSAMPEIAGDAAWLINPYESEELRHAIITLLQQPETCRTLVEKGKQRVRAFTWEKCRQQVLKLYHHLLS